MQCVSALPLAQGWARRVEPLLWILAAGAVLASQANAADKTAGGHDDQRERLIALHARCLAFRHPTSKVDLRFEAPLTQTWKELGLPEEYLGL